MSKLKGQRFIASLDISDLYFILGCSISYQQDRGPPLYIDIYWLPCDSSPSTWVCDPSPKISCLSFTFSSFSNKKPLRIHAISVVICLPGLLPAFIPKNLVLFTNTSCDVVCSGVDSIEKSFLMTKVATKNISISAVLKMNKWS